MPQPALLFSVIIPAFQKPDALRECLEALCSQTFAASRFEVIVIDDGSLPPLEPVVTPFASRLNIRYRRVANAGPAAARNHGARLATGQYLAFTDHDCRPAPAWLQALSSAFARHTAPTMLGGPKWNGLPANIYSAAHQVASNFAEDWFRLRHPAASYCTTNNLAVERKAFLATGGFNESFPFAHEDREFAARWSDRGLAREWVADAPVEHRHALTLRAFLHQQFRYGAGAVDFRRARAHAPAASQDVRFEGIRFHLGLLAGPFADQPFARAIAISTMLAAAQAAYLTGVAARALKLD